MLTVAQVFALADAIDPRYRALVLLATFTSLRWGELCALRESDIDMDARTVQVQRSLTELQNGALAFGPAQVRRWTAHGRLPRTDRSGRPRAPVTLRPAGR